MSLVCERAGTISNAEVSSPRALIHYNRDFGGAKAV